MIAGMSRRLIAPALVATLAACGGGSSDSSTPSPGSAAAPGSGSAMAAKADPKPADPKPDPKAGAAITGAVGVTAGGIAHDKAEGPAGSVTSVSGTVEIRRVGEPDFKPAKLEDPLYAGDQIRSGDASSATVALADTSTVELAEVTTVGIGSRAGTADPASSAAVLAGLARFSVAPRAPGEGAFRVFTPEGVVMTKGTAYGVGVSADGQARVGVEDGTVDVVGLAALDAPPVEVSGGSQATLDTAGKVASPSPWPEDDWGAWRDGLDAKVTSPTVALDAHAAALTDLHAQLQASYTDLDTTAKDVATFEATAATAEAAQDPAAYTTALPDGSATIDASFGVAGRTEALTWAYAGHAVLATDLYARHPQELAPRWEVVAPHVDAAVLWPKRYEITTTAYLEPLRMQYYVHHPVGRVHAPLVGVAVPTFYAQVEPPPLEPVRVRAHVRAPIWMAPDLAFRAQARPVWVAAPEPAWHTTIKIAPRPPRARVGWYVRPPELRAKLIVGAPPERRYESHLVVAPVAPRAEIRGVFAGPTLGARVHVGPPDYHAAAVVRTKVQLDPRGHVIVRDHRGPAPVVVKGGGAIDVVRDHRGPAIHGGVEIKGGVELRDHRGPAPVHAPPAPTVRDHRAPAPAHAPAPTVRDHRAPAPAKTPVVRDHRH